MSVEKNIFLMNPYIVTGTYQCSSEERDTAVNILHGQNKAPIAVFAYIQDPGDSRDFKNGSAPLELAQTFVVTSVPLVKSPNGSKMIPSSTEFSLLIPDVTLGSNSNRTKIYWSALFV